MAWLPLTPPPNPRSLSKTSQMPLDPELPPLSPFWQLQTSPVATPSLGANVAAVPPLHFGGERSVRLMSVRPLPFFLTSHPLPRVSLWKENASRDPPCAKVPYPTNPVEET